METALTAAYSACKLIYQRLQKTKSNDAGLDGLKIRVEQLLAILEKRKSLVGASGGSLNVGELQKCLDSVTVTVEGYVNKTGLFKFGKASDIEAAIARANQKLDNQLGAFGLSALMHIIADASSLKNGQNAMNAELKDLKAMLQQNRDQRDRTISSSISPTHNQGVTKKNVLPTLNPAQLPAPRPSPSGGGVTKPIYFGTPGEPANGLSNNAPYPVMFEGNCFATASHLYAAFGFFESHPPFATLIQTTTSPETALSLARDLSGFRRPDWSYVAITIMEFILTLKFEQHPELTRLLLKTGEADLIFRADHPVWGTDGKSGKGENQLGRSLMRVGSALRNSPVYFNASTNFHSSFDLSSLHPVTYKGKAYLSCQHLYQSLKFMSVNEALVVRIASIIDPNEAHNFAKKHEAFQRFDWLDINILMMEACLVAKFEQYPALKEELLATGTRPLMYLNDNDTFWGSGAMDQGGTRWERSCNGSAGSLGSSDTNGVFSCHLQILYELLFLM